jgi:hypothetical protein
VGLVVEKAALGQVFSEYFGFPCQSSFHPNFSTIIITRGWHNMPTGGRSAEWTQLDSTPPPNEFKKKSPANSHSTNCSTFINHPTIDAI